MAAVFFTETVVLSFLLSLGLAWMGLRAVFHVIGSGTKLQPSHQQPAPRS